jgi:uncharacterized SAM-binding protein YcdF (DUF218 family)
MESLGCERHLGNRLGLGLLVVGLSTILAFSGPFLVVHDVPQVSDAIVVIGGDHKPERVRRAVELYRQGYAPVVVISAGTIVLEGDEWMPEAKVMQRYEGCVDYYFYQPDNWTPPKSRKEDNL